ncbi:unnamed protein product [Lampetra fluviatilis]
MHTRGGLSVPHLSSASCPHVRQTGGAFHISEKRGASWRIERQASCLASPTHRFWGERRLLDAIGEAGAARQPGGAGTVSASSVYAAQPPGSSPHRSVPSSLFRSSQQSPVRCRGPSPMAVGEGRGTDTPSGWE